MPADIISEGPTPRQTSTQAEEESTQVTARELAPARAGGPWEGLWRSVRTKSRQYPPGVTNEA